MNWYKKLRNYFPVEEMKSEEQFSALLAEQNDHYYVEENDDYIILLDEFEDFIFIDFLWVSPETRGRGVGRKIIKKLQAKNKTILIEVEPVDDNDSDTERRLSFYERLGFKYANSIQYTYQAFVSQSETELNIMYWSTGEPAEEDIYQYMKVVYEKVHSYKAEEFYGIKPKSSEEVVQFSY